MRRILAPVLSFVLTSSLVAQSARWLDPRSQASLGTGEGALQFADVSRASGLAYTQVGRCGVAIGDVNGDAWPDVALAGSPSDGVKIFRNRHDKTFVDESARVLPPGLFNATKPLFADVDSDGDQDLLLTRWYDDGGQDVGFALLRNDAGLFTETTQPTDLARSSQSSGGVAVADVDSDGDLDVVFFHYNGPGAFLKNDGTGNFVDATLEFGAEIATSRRAWNSVLADFNGDQKVDLHCSIDGGHDFQCRNLGNGVFVDVSVEAGVSSVWADMGTGVGDIENDGDLDIYSTNIGGCVLYVNDGSGHFVDEAAERGVAAAAPPDQIFVGWGNLFADFDNDGDEDLVFVSGTIDPGELFENDGTGHFTEATDASGLYLRGFGLASFDYDLDGDLDLLSSGANDSAVLYENLLAPPGSRSDLPSTNHWLEVTLHGTSSNRDAIGAKVEVVLPDRTLTRWVVSGASFTAEGPRTLHFGLGAFDHASSVRVTWPSGTVQVLQPVYADRRRRVLEPSASPLWPR